RQALSNADHQRLTELMLNLPGMRDPAQRAAHIGSFLDHLGTTPASDVGNDLWKLIATCHGIPGGTRQLVTFLADDGRAHPALVEMALLVEAIDPPPLLADHERDELIELAQHASPAQATAAWRHASPDRDAPSDESLDLSGMVCYIEMFTTLSGQA